MSKHSDKLFVYRHTVGLHTYIQTGYTHSRKCMVHKT